MTRPRRSTIVVARRVIAVERRAVRPFAAGRCAKVGPTASGFPTSCEGAQPEALTGGIVAEVEDCLRHRPIRFPQKLWGEVL